MSLDKRIINFNSSDYSEAAKNLLIYQKASWEQCFIGYESLKSIQVKEFKFDNFTIKVQFNPGRLTSSSAKVEPQFIKERKCFLCINNLPEGQKGILYNQHYIILCNPFPIFPEHFTIPSIEHKPQEILTSFRDLLTLSKDISGRYLAFYNGPRCGASAPDHMHFQAGNKNFMPLINEYPELKKKHSKSLLTVSNTEINAVDDGFRKLIVFEGNSADEITAYFNILYKEMEYFSSPGEEPMMNIISRSEQGKWVVIVIPREKHRPSRYFEEGENNILLSPASVDLGGVCITPLEKDFLKISRNDLTEIFKEVTLNNDKFSLLVKNLLRSFKNPFKIKS